MTRLPPPLTQKQIALQFPDTLVTYANHRLRFLERAIKAFDARMEKIMNPPGPRPPPTP